MWSRNDRGTKFRIPKSIYKDGIVERRIEWCLHNKSVCSDDVKMSTFSEEVIAVIRNIEERKSTGINIVFVR